MEAINASTATRREDIPAEPAVREDAQAVGQLAPGVLVGDFFEITGVLGIGGMSIVYEAVDRFLNRRVALKFVTGGHAQALRDEAQALAAVRHHGIPTVFGAGTHGDHAFLVLEALNGTSLDTRIAESVRSKAPIPIDEVIDILHKVADALSAVHRAGICHRDVKSSNVMLAGGRVMLLDFGIMQPEWDVARGASLAGTASAMAPELIGHKIRPGGGARVDLYALGVLGYEMLAGKLPYAASEVVALFAMHVGAPVPDVRAQRPDVPAELAALIAELMAKQPDDRPDSAEVVVWRLEAMTKPARPAPFRAVVIDDDRSVREALRKALESAMPGLVVETHGEGRVALSSIEARPPALVLVDVNMPDINGVEVCMRLLGMPRDRRPAIVAMSGDARAADVEVLKMLGVTSFVPKNEGFVAKVSEVVGEVRRSSIPPPRSWRPSPPR